MKARLSLAALVLIAVSPLCHAHRLDEYLQATTIAVAKDRIAVSMRLSPGVAVAPFILAAIDTDRDGVISEADQAGYASRLLSDLALSLDGDRLPLHLASTSFASVPLLRDGVGEMKIEYWAVAPSTNIAARRLRFDNSHQRQISVYLVNALVSQDPQIQIKTQTRNFEQSSYELAYSETSPVGFMPMTLFTGQRWFLLAAALAIIARFVFASLGSRSRSIPRSSHP